MLSSTEMENRADRSYVGLLAAYVSAVTVASVLGSWDPLGGLAVATTYLPAAAIVAGARLGRPASRWIAGVLATAALLTALAIANDDSSTASLLLLFVPPVTIPVAISVVALSRRS